MRTLGPGEAAQHRPFFGPVLRLSCLSFPICNGVIVAPQIRAWGWEGSGGPCGVGSPPSGKTGKGGDAVPKAGCALHRATSGEVRTGGQQQQAPGPSPLVRQQDAQLPGEEGRLHARSSRADLSVHGGSAQDAARPPYSPPPIAGSRPRALTTELYPPAQPILVSVTKILLFLWFLSFLFGALKIVFPSGSCE